MPQLLSSLHDIVVAPPAEGAVESPAERLVRESRGARALLVERLIATRRLCVSLHQGRHGVIALAAPMADACDDLRQRGEELCMLLPAAVPVTGVEAEEEAPPPMAEAEAAAAAEAAARAAMAPEAVLRLAQSAALHIARSRREARTAWSVLQQGVSAGLNLHALGLSLADVEYVAQGCRLPSRPPLAPAPAPASAPSSLTADRDGPRTPARGFLY